MKIFTYDERKRKNVSVGDFSEGTKTFTTNRTYKKHFVWKYRGYGIGQSVLRELARLGCVSIRIKEKDTKTVWKSSLRDWKFSGVSDNLGSGVQYFLARENMRDESKKPAGFVSVGEIL